MPPMMGQGGQQGQQAVTRRKGQPPPAMQMPPATAMPFQPMPSMGMGSLTQPKQGENYGGDGLPAIMELLQQLMEQNRGQA